ncbi:MAG: hypothetical protein JST75_08940 [Bacteroidetes bacterium]|nr:hypothetical protein [Bacteroidota bacterium]
MYHNNYFTAVDAIIDLQSRGYVYDFSESRETLLCAQQKIFLKRHEFVVTETYHFYGEEPSTHYIISAIEATNYFLKGILLTKQENIQPRLPFPIEHKAQKQILEDMQLMFA